MGVGVGVGTGVGEGVGDGDGVGVAGGVGTAIARALGLGAGVSSSAAVGEAVIVGTEAWAAGGSLVQPPRSRRRIKMDRIFFIGKSYQLFPDNSTDKTECIRMRFNAYL